MKMAQLHHLLEIFRGALSSATLSKEIVEVISKCRWQLIAWLVQGKHSPYKYRPTLPSEIGKYASQHGASTAARHFM